MGLRTPTPPSCDAAAAFHPSSDPGAAQMKTASVDWVVIVEASLTAIQTRASVSANWSRRLLKLKLDRRRPAGRYRRRGCSRPRRGTKLRKRAPRDAPIATGASAPL